jgi:acyl-CoA carboxylase subunit beta
MHASSPSSTGASWAPGPSLPADPPVHDPDELPGTAPADVRVPFDPREVIARVVEGSRFGEYKPEYGTSIVTGWAAIHGFPVGILANANGVLFSEEAEKATEFPGRRKNDQRSDQ